MTVVAARHGYAEASVARVIKQAGMSRATFYEHFEDRDDCFLAAVRKAAEPVRRELGEGESRLAGADPLREGIDALLTAADTDPAGTRLLLVEAMAGGAAARAEREALLEEVEVAVDRHLDALAARGRALEIPAGALLGGLVNLVSMRVFRHEGGLPALLDELLAWLDAHALPPGRKRLDLAGWRELGRAYASLERAPPSASPGRVVKPLPRDGSGRARGEIAGEQRQRAIRAIARCSWEKGYAATTVADIVAAAGIGRAAFYEQFRNKEDVYLAAQAHGLEGAAAVTAARFFGEAPWPERIWNACDGLLEYISGRPHLAHMQMVESYSVGVAALRRSLQNRMAFTLFLEEGYRQRPEAEALPRVSSEAATGGIEELIRHRVARGQTAAARELVPQCAYVALAPFLGAEAAMDFVRERSRRPA
ncbi:MAG TPA: helix-turn-helix domain-containing protein [Solirubrobacterales bacterium]|nr:helix-turn-helix domain-containing protein [Solirubrobacterales bacterium]